jgi:hypothetical protein
MRAIEVPGHIDEHRTLHLDAPIEGVEPTPVRVILLFPDESDLTEQEWLQAIARNPALDFLRDPSEDIYTPTDGKPLGV